MSTLRTTITELASQFAAGVLNAIRGASLEDILAETNRGGSGVRRGPGRPAKAAMEAAEGPGIASARGRKRGGRLGRRSADDIGEVVERIVSLLNTHTKGLRAEEIREKLGLEAKELPRPIADALASKKIIKQGQKRATTYFARGKGPASAPAAKAGRKAGSKKSGAKKVSAAPKKGAKRGKRPAEAKVAVAAKAGAGKKGGGAKANVKGKGKGKKKAAAPAASAAAPPAPQTNGAPTEEPTPEA